MKIIILTSNFTGHGHASITDALIHALSTYEDIEYTAVESLNLTWKIIKKMCKQYGKVTNKFPWAWGMYYRFINNHPDLINRIVQKSAQRKFNLLMNQYKPDAIITVHPMFVGCVLDMLEERESDAKFYTVIADLVSINRLWIDKRADLIFCPTVESLNIAKSIVRREDILKKSTIPTRHAINEVARKIEIHELHKEDVKCIVISGGEGSGDLAQVVDALLIHPKTKITVVTGRNKKLYKKLNEKYKQNNRVEVFGFVKEIYDLIPVHDIAIVRASPNVLMECINLLTPIITIGHLPGQEKGNDKWIQEQGLGVICNRLTDLSKMINNLLEDDRAGLKEISLSQKAYRNLSASNEILDTILQARE